MSIADAQGNWTQIQADRFDRMAGVRALMPGHRRQARSRLTPAEIVEVSVSADNIEPGTGLSSG